MTFQLPNDNAWCHHTGFKEKCLKLVSCGKCKRWRSLPGEDAFTGAAREHWGCVDDLVLQLQGQTLRETSGNHAAMTQLREMAIDPEYRRQAIAKANELKTIEAPTCKSPS